MKFLRMRVWPFVAFMILCWAGVLYMLYRYDQAMKEQVMAGDLTALVSMNLGTFALLIYMCHRQDVMERRQRRMHDLLLQVAHRYPCALQPQDDTDAFAGQRAPDWGGPREK